MTLWIDSYSDIFSDFDPRPFSERAVSDDFITQVKRVSRESSGKVSVLRLLVPDGTQKEEHEKVIKKRLRSYFQRIAMQLNHERKTMRRRGFAFTTFGVILMILATSISFLGLSDFAFKLLLALFEPGGWFLLWTGMDLIILNSWGKMMDQTFFDRFADVHVEFSSYKI